MKISLRNISTSVSLPVAVAFALRVGYVWMLKHHAPVPFFDIPYGYETGHIAQSIALGKGFSSPLTGLDSGPTAWLTPIFPYLLAGVFKLFGIFTYTSFLTIVTIDCLFSALACIPVFFIGKRLAGMAAGLTAAWIWALFPIAIIIPLTWVWDTCLASAMVGFVLWATLALQESHRPRAWIGYGLLWAFTLMVNPAILSLLPFILLWLAWRLRGETRLWLKLPAVAALTIVIGCVPWTVRNYIAFHKLIPLRSNFGLELWLGNNTQVTDTLTRWLHPDGNLPERQKFAQLGEIQYMQQKQHDAFQFMRSHPRQEARLVWNRFADNWTGTYEPIPDIWRTLGWEGQLTIATNCLLAILSLTGVLVLFRQKRAEAWLFAVFPVVYPLIYYVTHTSARYREPIDPVLCVLAAFTLTTAVSAVMRQFATRRNASSGSETLNGSTAPSSAAL